MLSPVTRRIGRTVLLRGMGRMGEEDARIDQDEWRPFGLFQVFPSAPNFSHRRIFHPVLARYWVPLFGGRNDGSLLKLGLAQIPTNRSRWDGPVGFVPAVAVGAHLVSSGPAPPGTFKRRSTHGEPSLAEPRKQIWLATDGQHSSRPTSAGQAKPQPLDRRCHRRQSRSSQAGGKSPIVPT